MTVNVDANKGKEAVMGIVMLDTRFPRIQGDIGNASTWSFPVQYRVVKDADPDKIIRRDPMVFVEKFIEAANELAEAGCDGITTSCGFLALAQREIASAVRVPVATSSLMQIPMVQAMLPPDKKVAVLTISKETLTPDHLRGAGVVDPRNVPIFGTEGGRPFTRGILGNHEEINFADCRLDLIDAARKIARSDHNIGAIVMECTNMPPYAADVQRETGLPVFSIYSFVNWFYQSLTPSRFPLESGVR